MFLSLFKLKLAGFIVHAKFLDLPVQGDDPLFELQIVLAGENVLSLAVRNFESVELVVHYKAAYVRVVDAQLRISHEGLLLIVKKNVYSAEHRVVLRPRTNKRSASHQVTRSALIFQDQQLFLLKFLKSLLLVHFRKDSFRQVDHVFIDLLVQNHYEGLEPTFHRE